ncbi:hypothetical protein [Chamaesiphon polymorphus]|uniref:Uncharacterized protein n=1 Tax=Chamaesiphon polymorphus CCALA 037 TaxID=2107692 RepID=A0A2T1FGH4_9CYAN|nr:hypothetical protein [Chamaesiphon polymorphus]PSB44054.1 hypothetical protein C7B77_25850 [Chamaesiphon polymorphus CCALA 037]
MNSLIIHLIVFDMSRGFTSIIWVWDADGETRKIECVNDLGYSLENLALSQTQQEECISDCLFCELYIPFLSAYGRFSEEVLLYAPLELQVSLSQISESFDKLDESEKECWNRDILKRSGWNKIRNLSKKALLQMEWEELTDYRDYSNTKMWGGQCPPHRL